MDRERLKTQLDNRFYTYEFETQMAKLVMYRSLEEFIHSMDYKLQAEIERVSRLLPDPPKGYEWTVDRQTMENPMKNTISVRGVFKLERR